MLRNWLTALFVGLSLIFCVSTSALAGDKIFAMVPKRNGPYYKPCYEGFEDAGKKFGVTTVYVASEDAKLELQIEIIEKLIERKITGIAISALDAKGLNDVIKKATDAGIKVLCFDSDAPTSTRLSYIGTNNVNAGKTGAEELAKLVGNQGDVAVLQSKLTESNLNMRYDGFMSYMSGSAPEIKVLDRIEDQASYEVAIEKVEEMIEANPNLKGIFSLAAIGAPATAFVLEDAELEGKVMCGGFDDLPDTIEAIKSGSVQFCLAQMTYKMGWLSLAKLLDASEGKEIPSEIDTGMMVINNENIDTYKEQMKKEAQKLK